MMTYWKWGDWIESRAHFVGLRSRNMLRRALDVSDRHLTRWLKMENPPNLQNRSIEMLAEVLRTDVQTIKYLYQSREPNEVPLVGLPHKTESEATASTSQKSQFGDGALRREIKGVADTLAGDELQQMHAMAMQIMAAKLQRLDSKSPLKIAAHEAPKPKGRSIPKKR